MESREFLSIMELLNNPNPEVTPKAPTVREYCLVSEEKNRLIDYRFVYINACL